MHSAGQEIDSQPQLEALSTALRLHDIALLHLSMDGVFDLATNLPASWPQSDIVGKSIEDALPQPLGGLFSEALEQCRQFAAERILEYELTEAEQPRIFEIKMVPNDTGFLATVRDISAARRQDEAIRMLMREVSHRSKNLLAIVQSVAVQTARYSDDIEQFLEKFRGRLYALSSTQDLVTDSDWRGTHFRTLLNSQFGRLSLDTHTNTTVSGADPVLGPNAALHVGLALHELGSNARLYGALSPSAAGKVAINAQLDTGDDGPSQLVVEWHEERTRQDPSGGVPRFGTLVLKRIVPLSVGGTAELTMGENQLHYRLTIPVNQLAS